MPLCIVVPGFLGSVLSTVADPVHVVWVSYTALAFGQVGKLRLDAAGTGPGPPDGEQLAAGLPLRAYYDPCVQALTKQLAREGYSVVPFGFDWRFRIRPTGVQLANLIRSRVTADAPCTLVGHSNGGMVCRAAWEELGRGGEHNLVRRIVTLGTPHYGSYAAANLFCLNQDLLGQVGALSSTAPLLSSIVFPPSIALAWSIFDVQQLCATWPAAYELMPTTGAPDQAGDPSRPKLYVASNWPSSRQLSAAWLNEVDTDFNPWSLTPGTIPPNWVLTAVVGTGSGTNSRLVSWPLLGYPPAIGGMDDGDGTVTVTSATGPAAETVALNCRHVDLPNTTAASGLLASLILDPRSGPVPPPSARSVPGVIVPGLQPPPAAARLWPDP